MQILLLCPKDPTAACRLVYRCIRATEYFDERSVHVNIKYLFTEPCRNRTGDEHGHGRGGGATFGVRLTGDLDKHLAGGATDGAVAAVVDFESIRVQAGDGEHCVA